MPELMTAGTNSNRGRSINIQLKQKTIVKVMLYYGLLWMLLIALEEMSLRGRGVNCIHSEYVDGNSLRRVVFEIKDKNIEASTQADSVVLSEVSRRPPSLLTGWRDDGLLVDRPKEIAVTLVTQCSLDRLPNLKEQLSTWKGRASVAVYLKPSEDTEKAASDILATIDQEAGGSSDVAITLVKGCTEGELYPINYLRNIALLEAQRQHLRFAPSLDKSAVLLVDVDFRPSSNLHEMLHTSIAADLIMKEGKVVVCPAFEYWAADTCPRSVQDLKKLVYNGKAEGFHYSVFPNGHGPTQFDKFWEKSLNCTIAGNTSIVNKQDCFWKNSYKVQHEYRFEPYVVMASGDVPLYDERFQGYGLNKIPHLDSVAAVKNGEFLVLPGVFLAAPKHKRSKDYYKHFGKTKESKQNLQAVRALYSEFLENLKEGRPPVVSERTRAMKTLLSVL